MSPIIHVQLCVNDEPTFETVAKHCFNLGPTAAGNATSTMTVGINKLVLFLVASSTVALFFHLLDKSDNRNSEHED